MLDKPKLCINCNNAIKSAYNADIYYCKATEYINLVTGEPSRENCEFTRMTSGLCGKEAKLFNNDPF